MFRKITKLLVISLAILVLFTMATAFTANINSVPITFLWEEKRPVTINALKPAQCSALVLTAIVFCPSAGGQCDGTDASELILGSPIADTVRAGKGDDCILGGGGNDTIRGENGIDVCIGGPGQEAPFHPSCETGLE